MFDSNCGTMPHSYQAKLKRSKGKNDKNQRNFRSSKFEQVLTPNNLKSKLFVTEFLTKSMGKDFYGQSETIPLICLLQSPMYQNFPLCQM